MTEQQLHEATELFEDKGFSIDEIALGLGVSATQLRTEMHDYLLRQMARFLGKGKKGRVLG